jgi:hypothetical protein
VERETPKRRALSERFPPVASKACRVRSISSGERCITVLVVVAEKALVHYASHFPLTAFRTHATNLRITKSAPPQRAME